MDALFLSVWGAWSFTIATVRSVRGNTLYWWEYQRHNGVQNNTVV
jgi:hypothetical protein